MKVDILEPIGYCKGVELAIQKAINLSKKYDKICVLGMLVHTNDALKELESNGIITIYSKDKKIYDLIDEIPQGYKVILTAHGHELKVEEKLQKLGIEYFDLTCPKVLLAEEKIKEIISLGHQIIFIGKKNHPEANAMVSISSDIFLYDINSDFDFSQIKDLSPFVMSQTTFSKDEINNIYLKIKEVIKDAKIIENVCNASNLRQQAVKNIKNDADAIIVVGGFNSNNTKTLYYMAKSLYPNCLVIHVENLKQIIEKDLKGLNHVYMLSGASTPKHIILEIKDYLESI